MQTRRRLSTELVRRGLCADEAQAEALILSGRVLVGGAPAAEASRQVAPGDSVALRPEAARFVSRGGEKLDGALAAFGFDVSGLRALDAGASTGGFTDCLLQRGAARVIAADVGHGLLAWKLQQDPRVTVMDRTNVRYLTADAIGGPVDLIVADLSFIGLATVAEALGRCLSAGGHFVLLVKPQFEAPKAEVGAGGIVRDPAVRARVLHSVVAALSAVGLIVESVTRSPITGATGNIEYLIFGGPAATPVPREAIDALISEEGKA